MSSTSSAVLRWTFFSLIASQSAYLISHGNTRAYSPLLNLLSPLMSLCRLLGELVLPLKRFTACWYRFRGRLYHFRLHPLLLLPRQSILRFLNHSIEDWILPRNKRCDFLVNSWYSWRLFFYRFSVDDERQCRLSPYITCSYWMSSVA